MKRRLTTINTSNTCWQDTVASTHTRPNISYGAKELARSLQAPTQFDNKKLKRMNRYLKGTRRVTQPATKDTNTGQTNSTQHRHVHRCQLGITRDYKEERNRICVILLWSRHYGSATQATIALSSAESELYAIGAAAQESLYISNFIKVAFEVRINIRMHRDSSAAKSIATREEWLSTTATLATSTPTTRQVTGTVKRTMTTTGTARIRHRCNDNHHS